MNNSRRAISQAERALEAALDNADLTKIVQFENQLLNLRNGLDVAEKYYAELFPTEVVENV